MISILRYVTNEAFIIKGEQLFLSISRSVPVDNLQKRIMKLCTILLY